MHQFLTQNGEKLHKKSNTKTEKKVSKASSYPWLSVATEKESTEAVSPTPWKPEEVKTTRHAGYARNTSLRDGLR